MKLTYYGTAAAEGFPALYCHCEACEKARKLGAKNIRTRSQALVNDDLLIDFPADTYMHELFYGLDLRTIKNIIITHDHDDHLYVNDLCKRTQPDALFPNGVDKKPINIYASRCSGKEIKKEVAKKTLKDSEVLRYHDIKPFNSYEIGDYLITPLKASHAPGHEALIYIIKQGDKTILYANDTGYFLDETWKYIEKSGIVFDLVSLDCTLEIGDNYENHMGFDNCVRVKERMLKTNANDKTIFVINHFSHNCKVVYDDFVSIAAQEGFLVSYDTFEITI